MTRSPALPPETVVVVGAGLAGARTVQELRAAGFAGAITLLGAEPHPPYDRPPLSKGDLAGDTGDFGMDFEALGVDFHPDTHALALHGWSPTQADPLRVVVSGNRELPAAAVVVATGATPVVAPGWSLSERVHVLRTRSQAEGVNVALAGPHVGVLGGSWLGMELASQAVARGSDVTVVERAATVVPRLPPAAGEVVARWCAAAGVHVRLGSAVTSVTTVAGPSAGVEVGVNRTSVRFDAAVVALGVRPDTDWLADSGVPLAPGSAALRVDAWLRSPDPRVLGVGDAIARWSPKYGAWLPGGHWQDAMDAPMVAARSLLAGLTTAAELPAPYDAVPYFWSEMFGHMLQWTGYVPDPSAVRLVRRGATTSDSWSMCWLDGEDRLVGLLACNRPRDAIAARKAQAVAPHGAPWADIARVSDPDQPLKSCLSAVRGE